MSSSSAGRCCAWLKPSAGAPARLEGGSMTEEGQGTSDCTRAEPDPLPEKVASGRARPSSAEPRNAVNGRASHEATTAFLTELQYVSGDYVRVAVTANGARVVVRGVL